MSRSEHLRDDEDSATLQDNDQWDFATAERRRALPDRRAIVSVTFLLDEFALVAEAARGNEQSLANFIRDATLERARGRAAS
jgi:hypothetical protein